MIDQLNTFATNYAYAVPSAILLTVFWLYFQKQRVRTASKMISIDTPFIVRNSVFVGLLVFAVVYFGKPLPALEESMYVSPADF